MEEPNANYYLGVAKGMLGDTLSTQTAATCALIAIAEAQVAQATALEAQALAVEAQAQSLNRIATALETLASVVGVAKPKGYSFVNVWDNSRE